LGYIDGVQAHHQHIDVDDALLAGQQDIIPQSLLENYLGMVDPSRAQTVDTEITRHCAYNLPAVAYTLGRHNWHCIKHLYETLAQAMQVGFCACSQ
jgi:serine/threonine-protein phosphatase 4 regulatory subunit 1